MDPSDGGSFDDDQVGRMEVDAVGIVAEIVSKDRRLRSTVSLGLESKE